MCGEDADSSLGGHRSHHPLQAARSQDKLLYLLPLLPSRQYLCDLCSDGSCWVCVVFCPALLCSAWLSYTAAWCCKQQFCKEQTALRGGWRKGFQILTTCTAHMWQTLCRNAVLVLTLFSLLAEPSQSRAPAASWKRLSGIFQCQLFSSCGHLLRKMAEGHRQSSLTAQVRAVC